MKKWLKKPAICEACSGRSVNHTSIYVTVALDECLRPLFTPGKIGRFFASPVCLLERRLTPLLLSFLVQIGWAKKILQPDDHTQLLAQMLWQEAQAQGINMWECRLFNLPRNLFVATFPGGSCIAFEGIPLPTDRTPAVAWMDNKGILKKKFQTLGFPVARGGYYFSPGRALSAFHTLTPPVIVKPHSGSASRHTTLHITTDSELLNAFESAKKLSPFAVVEEELVGSVYRATVVDGNLVGVLRRDPPSVVGDGTLTVAALIDKANEHPARKGPYFSPICLTSLAHAELSWQKVTLSSIPEKGRRVTFHQKINWSLGGTTADVTDEVHQDTRKLFEDISRTLNAAIVGIDFIIGDIRASYKTQPRCGVIECNSMPFFDNHHLPFEGKPRNVARKIWAMVTPRKNVAFSVSAQIQ
jgi:D-alanine-D-alanine ligase-like ATP-grasp enzyme